jgi:hypothetical protein
MRHPLFALILLVYWPRLLQEEATLAKRFPSQLALYYTIPRLVPNPFCLPAVLDSNQFSPRRARRNLGVRSLGALVFVPVFLKVLVYLMGGGG